MNSPEAVYKPSAEPGLVVCVHSFGNLLKFHPHLHVMVTDGAFTTAGSLDDLPVRITVNPKTFREKPIIRGRRLAVEHVLEMLAVGDTPEAILEGYPWLERDDIRACLEYAHRLVGHERIEPFSIEIGA